MRTETLLLAILTTSFVLSLLFAIRIPFGDNPDERDHWNYIRLLVEERGFVRFIAGDPNRYQTHQPPAYYLLAAPLFAATGGNYVVLRLINIVLHLLTVFVAFRTGRDIFPDRAEIAVGTAAFVAFLPTQAQLAGAITNDPLTTLICAAIFWRLARVVNGEADTRNAVFLGALLGAGLLTKLSVLQLLPAILLAYAMTLQRGPDAARRALVQAGIVVGLAVLIALPWLVRNTRLYGDPLTIRIYPLTGPNFTPGQMMEMMRWSFSDYLANVATRTFATFWFFLPPNIIRPAIGPLLLALALALGGLFGTWRWMRAGQGEPGQRRAVGLYLAGIFFLMPFFLRFTLQLFQAQGRYFLPALLPDALIACLGWTNVGGRARIAGALGVGGILLALSLYALSGGAFFG